MVLFAQRWGVAFAVLLGASSVHAELPSDRLAVLLARALAYDGRLHDRAGATVDVAVLYRSGDAAALTQAQRQAGAFNALADLRVSGLPLKAFEVPWTTQDALAAAIKEKGIDEVFLVGAFDAERDKVRAACEPAHVLTMAGDRASAEAGIALAVDEEAGKPTIFVNVDTSKAAGAELGGGLLRLAVIVKQGKR